MEYLTRHRLKVQAGYWTGKKFVDYYGFMSQDPAPPFPIERGPGDDPTVIHTYTIVQSVAFVVGPSGRHETVFAGMWVIALPSDRLITLTNELFHELFVEPLKYGGPNGVHRPDIGKGLVQELEVPKRGQDLRKPPE